MALFPPAPYDIKAGRFVVHEDYLDFVGFDFTGATFAMQVRDRPNGGALRADLSTVTTAAAEGVRLDSVTTVDGITTSRVAWRINKATMKAMPLAADPEADNLIHYDLKISPAGETEYVAAEGTFTIKNGVTE